MKSNLYPTLFALSLAVNICLLLFVIIVGPILLEFSREAGQRDVLSGIDVSLLE